ncbi:oligo-1,6-glucosidase [Sphingomonas vulcanisoli]|uniref:Oligo-1,6-glucosidase n=1 Tax=Sphingomonas vulcanisoli TaxID=1658060 RepID=A0ABX0TWR5_9SPHN|nr:alpha-glucosidase [Sphingomonas vulcanisoli]NIJ08584.1 oligo-1,6-glucosidase [Sphingomonas vulcanisoli]
MTTAAGLSTRAGAAPAVEPWWQSATGYQIYPASFADSNGDGVGDIAGIIGKLDYLQDLGIGFIWLSPVYASPMVDNGYDISDYQAINPRFGALKEMDRLIAEARARGIGIVMDLVVNHTSDQHAWFQQARRSKTSPYRNYYLWRDNPPAKGAPDDMTASFGGSTWSYDAQAGAYYFHMFAAQQPDLNWANPAMRADIYKMMNWWLDRGIAGFRMDVIDLIGKDIAHGITANGPNEHPYLQEMTAATQAGRDCLTVGEVWSATPDNAPLYSDPARHELSMIFQFEAVTRFWDDQQGKWKPKPIDLPVLKSIFGKWQAALATRGWSALFWGNHDLPRAVSRYGDDGAGRVASAKMLATVLHLMKGTPYIYQGEEIGMTNAGFTSIDQYRDVETINLHAIALQAGIKDADFMAGARANSRDNARTPMQWTDGPNAGFSRGRPWIAVNPNKATINAAADSADPNGVYQRYRLLIALRKALPIIRQGSFRLIQPNHKQIFAYERRLGEDRLLVIANFTGTPATLPLTPNEIMVGRDLLSGADRTLSGTTLLLQPYETMALLRASPPGNAILTATNVLHQDDRSAR